MILIGYYARLKGTKRELLRFQWLADNTFQIWVTDKWEDANPREFDIIEVGQITADTPQEKKPINPNGIFMLAMLGQEMGLYEKDLEYDDHWHGATYLYTHEFLGSKYDVDTKSEYDCIVDYLTPKAKEAIAERKKLLEE